MISKDDIVMSGTTELEEIKEGEVVGMVLQIKDAITRKPVNEWSTEGLVDHVFTLCKIMDNLSELKDTATLIAEASDEVYDSAVRDEYIRLKESGEKMTDTMAKSLAERKNDHLKQEELTSKYKARVLNDLYKDCERLINFTQTKIKSLVDSQIRTNIPNN